MHLIKFLLFGVLISLIFGEFGRFPFGASNAVSLTDISLMLLYTFFLIWHVQNRSLNSLLRKAPRIITSLWVFQGAAVISLIVALRVFSFFEVMTGALYLIRFIMYSNVLLVVWWLIKEKVLSVKILENWLIGVGVVITIFGYLQFILFPDFNFLTDFGYDPHIGRLSSTFLDPNFSALFLCLCVALQIKKMIASSFPLRKQYWEMALLIATMGAIIVSFSRSGYLMLFLFLGLLSILRLRKLIVVLVLVIALGLAVSPRFYQRLQGAFQVDKSASERITSWQNALAVFQVNPITGVGFNTYRSAQENLNLFKVYSADGGHAGAGVDSSLLFVLATTGVLGFLSYLYFWFGSLKKMWTKQIVYFCAVVALLVSSQFVNALFYGPIMVYYFCLLGVSEE